MLSRGCGCLWAPAASLCPGPVTQRPRGWSTAPPLSNSGQSSVTCWTHSSAFCTPITVRRGALSVIYTGHVIPSSPEQKYYRNNTRYYGCFTWFAHLIHWFVCLCCQDTRSPLCSRTPSMPRPVRSFLNISASVERRKSVFMLDCCWCSCVGVSAGGASSCPTSCRSSTTLSSCLSFPRTGRTTQEPLLCLCPTSCHNLGFNEFWVLYT